MCIYVNMFKLSLSKIPLFTNLFTHRSHFPNMAKLRLVSPSFVLASNDNMATANSYLSFGDVSM